MEILTKLRKERGLTNEEMGAVLGVSKSRYNNWEIDRAEPNISTLIKLADFFCVTVDYLIGATPKDFNGETLSEEEKDLIKFYRGMNENGRDAVLTTARNFYNLVKDVGAKAN